MLSATAAPQINFFFRRLVNPQTFLQLYLMLMHELKCKQYVTYHKCIPLLVTHKDSLLLIESDFFSAYILLRQ